MGTRYAVLGVVQALILIFAYGSLNAETATILDVFSWLFLMLVACGIGLWPASERAEKAELAAERMSWADRIELKEPHEAGRTGAPARGMPTSARISRAG
jgi:hypothetical protein